MLVPIVFMRRLAWSSAIISVICLCLDISRSIGNTVIADSTGFRSALFLGDVCGLLIYPYFALTSANTKKPKTQSRATQILGRVLFVVVTLIAPAWEFHISSLIQRHDYQNSNLLQDAGGACWLGLSDYSAIVSKCNAIRARAIMMLIVILMALIETVLYARSNLGTETWVQQDCAIVHASILKEEADALDIELSTQSTQQVAPQFTPPLLQ
ncbi:hypothetical protein BGZ83_000741, partial [Gryganskiella cystojenkinii]